VLPPIGVNIAAKSTIASKIPFFVRDRFRSSPTADYQIISIGCIALLNWIHPLSRYGHGGHAAAARQISAIPSSGDPALHPDLQTARLKGQNGSIPQGRGGAKRPETQWRRLHPLGLDSGRGMRMRLIFGIIIGCALTIGGAYVADTVAAASGQPVMVNWDVVAKNWDRMTTYARESWRKIAG
jgi:hypothetical protein